MNALTYSQSAKTGKVTVSPNAHFQQQKSQGMQKEEKTKPRERNKTNSQEPCPKQHKYWLYLDEDFKNQEIVKRNRTKILELKDTIIELRNSLMRFHSRIKQAEERI